MSAPLSSALPIFVGDCPIPIQYHPTGVLGDEQVQKRNLAKWLVHTPDTTIVTDTSGTKIPFSDFKTLLLPSDLSPTLVEFFCQLFNSKAIPGRKALVALESLLRPIVNNDITFAGFLDARALPPPCDLLLCLLQLTSATVAFLFQRNTPTVKVFNWMHEYEGSAGEIERAFEVRSTLHACLQ